MPIAGSPKVTWGSPLIEKAYRTARGAHSAPGHGAKKLSHPLAVAGLLSQQGFDETVIAAALLHDTVEDTSLTIEEIGRSFGAEVTTLVSEMSEDPRIGSYPARKSEARSRVIRDPAAAAIYAADKLVNTRDHLNGPPGMEGEKLDHYIKTLRLLSDSRPDLPFLEELSEEMARLVDREAGLDTLPSIELRATATRSATSPRLRRFVATGR
jgi:predicted HD phosphohydrolase